MQTYLADKEAARLHNRKLHDEFDKAQFKSFMAGVTCVGAILLNLGLHFAWEQATKHQEFPQELVERGKDDCWQKTYAMRTSNADSFMVEYQKCVDKDVKPLTASENYVAEQAAFVSLGLLAVGAVFWSISRPNYLRAKHEVEQADEQFITARMAQRSKSPFDFSHPD